MFLAINHLAIDSPEAGRVLEGRFAARANAMRGVPGFRGFELVRPIPSGAAHGELRATDYLVVTAWDNQAAFEAWRASDARGQAHGQAQGPHAGAQGAHAGGVSAHAGRPDAHPHAQGARAGAQAAHAHPQGAAAPPPVAQRSWLSTHEPFEAAYAPRWQVREQAVAAPITMMNVITVAPGHEATFEEVFRTREGGVEEREGFLSLEVLRPLAGRWEEERAGNAPERNGSTYVVFSRWESMEHHDAWIHSEAFRQAHARRRLPEGALLRSGVRAGAIVLVAHEPSANETGSA